MTIAPTMTSTSLGTLSFSIDSGGQVDDDGGKLAGEMASGGVGTTITDNDDCTSSLGQTRCATCVVAGATKDAAQKWALTGTLNPVTSSGSEGVTFSVTEQ